MKLNKLKFLIKPALITAAILLLAALTSPSALAAAPNTSGNRLESQTPPTTQSNALGKTITIPNPLKTTSFIELINRITNWLLIIGAPIMTLMIIVGAFQLMATGGNSDKITAARQTITWAVLGYALLLLSKSAIFIINEVLGIR